MQSIDKEKADDSNSKFPQPYLTTLESLKLIKSNHVTNALMYQKNQKGYFKYITANYSELYKNHAFN